MDEPDGLFQYLIYLIVALCSTIFGVLSKQLTGRIGRVEKKATDNHDGLHHMEIGMHNRFTEHETQDRKRDEDKRKELKRDFERLENRIETGHAEILKEIRNGRA